MPPRIGLSFGLIFAGQRLLLNHGTCHLVFFAIDSRLFLRWTFLHADGTDLDHKMSYFWLNVQKSKEKAKFKESLGINN